MHRLEAIRMLLALFRQRLRRGRARLQRRLRGVRMRRQWLEDRMVTRRLTRTAGSEAPPAASRAVPGAADAETLEAWIAALEGPWSGGWAASAEALGRSGDPGALDALSRALRAPDWRMRWSAVSALGWSGDARAVEPLMYALGDPHGWVRRRAAQSLGMLGAAAAPALSRLRAGLRRRIRSNEVRWGVRSALRRAIRGIEAANAEAPAELISASAPEGTGTEPEAAAAPAGRGTEPECAIHAPPCDALLQNAGPARGAEQPPPEILHKQLFP